MNKGDIWQVEIPASNGHEQAGIRPCILVADTTTSICIVIPITSNGVATRFPYTVIIKQSKDNGLGKDSVALVFHIRAIDKKRLKKKIGIIENMEKIDELLKDLLKI